MLKYSDGLTSKSVDSILVRLLPEEKSVKRRMNKLESFAFTRSQEWREWIEESGHVNNEEEVDDGERRLLTITKALVFQFEMHLAEERISREHEDFGTNADGSTNFDYCQYCYKDGKFLQECTMDEMIEHCAQFVDEVNKNMPKPMTKEEYKQMMHGFFPMLKRWR